MKLALKILSYCGLALTLLPSIGVFNGWIDLKTHFSLMVIGMILWFGSAPFWIKSKSLEEGE